MTVPGSLLSDCITWVRRIIKAPSPTAIPDSTIIEYINRFYMYDVPSRIQLFELKRQYTFLTEANKQIYNFPFNPSIVVNDDPPNQALQGYYFIRDPVYADGVQIPLFVSNSQFFRAFPSLVTNLAPIQGDGSAGTYSYTPSAQTILRGARDASNVLHPAVFITATNNAGSIVYIVDDGNGNLIQTDSSFQIRADPDTASGSVNYQTAAMSFTFDTAIPSGNDIRISTVAQQSGRPVAMLFFNNQITLFPLPDKAYKIECDAWITPAQFLDTDTSMPFFYMVEYLARGAARKILIDSKDTTQVEFYEPFFREAEMIVLRRSNNQREQERTPTIFSGPDISGGYYYNRY
jgi:hypothetical protein